MTTMSGKVASLEPVINLSVKSLNFEKNIISL